MAKLIYGCGYLGRRVAKLWQDSGETVYAATRSHERAAQWTNEGLRPLVCDVVQQTELLIPPEVTTVLWAVGFDRQPGADMSSVHVRGLSHVIASLPSPVHRFIYISSTGVYGQVAGAEVDENSECRPNRAGGRACLAAEELLRSSSVGSAVIVLRLAGLYGPQRIPRAADLKEGRPIDVPAQGWLNLIHVEDAARIVLLADERAAPPRTYVVSDGQPVQRGEFYAELARLLHSPQPRFIETPSEYPQTRRAGSDKRVNPRTMFAELQPQLAYPSYREGIAAIVAGT